MKSSAPQMIQAGQEVAVVEAMKMQNVLRVRLSKHETYALCQMNYFFLPGAEGWSREEGPCESRAISCRGSAYRLIRNT